MFRVHPSLVIEDHPASFIRVVHSDCDRLMSELILLAEGFDIGVFVLDITESSITLKEIEACWEHHAPMAINQMLITDGEEFLGEVFHKPSSKT